MENENTAVICENSAPTAPCAPPAACEPPGPGEAPPSCGGCSHCGIWEAARQELAEALASCAPQPPEAPPEPRAETIDVVDVRFRSGGKIYYFDPNGLAPAPGEPVILDTARGAEYGLCVAARHPVPAEDVVAPLRRLLRIATAQDRQIAAANHEKEKNAYKICRQKIAEHRLEMQLVSAECAFEGNKILFFFTADGRVDFRDLVKDLAATFRTRIELRQIGVRDKAKMVGGLGVCGKEFCCTQFMDEFQPVSIKMAKTQDLSLNPNKISGTCGRLMCCLKYEQEAYEDLLQHVPKMESFVDTPGGRGTIQAVDLLRQTVRVQMETAPDTLVSYRADEIAVLRNGRARKGDAPIPKDLAPISGQNARRRPSERAKPAVEEEDGFQTMFRKLDDYAAEPAPPEKDTRRQRRRRAPRAEPSEQPPAPEREAKPRTNYNRRPRKKRPPKREPGNGNAQ